MRKALLQTNWFPPSRRRPGRWSIAWPTTKRVLLAAYRSIARAVDEGRSITPAAEWLLDNYHVVEEQIREIRDDLPPGYYRQLPKLAEGPFAGYPRVFGIAWAFVAHTDSRFDPEMLRRFVRAYQTRPAADASASCGRWRSRCASCWSRTCGASPSAS